MSDYIRSIIKRKTDLADIEKKVLLAKGNLPVLSKAHTPLPPLQEVIVKSLYLSGGLFLSDIKKLLCFHADIQKVERAIKNLIKDGYLIYQGTALGNLYGLTGNGISQIRYHHDYYSGEKPSAVSDMKLDVEGSLTKRRVISSLIAEYVFQFQTRQLFQKYYTTDKLTRNIYLMQQFLKQILFRELLNQNEQTRKESLKDYPLSAEQLDSLLKATSYSQKSAEIFSNAYMTKWGFDELRQKNLYHEYIAFVRRECLTSPSENTFYLLKEMPEEKGSEYQVLDILLSWNCNILKYGMERVWNFLSEELTNNELLQKEQTLETCNQYIKYLGDERRSLIQTNAYKKKTDEELLKQITQKLTLLDSCLNGLRTKKELLETDFSFPVIAGYDEDGNSFEERVLTFKRLEQNAIYMEASQQGKLIFYVVQIQDDFFDLFSLHKKISILYQMCRRICPLYKLEVRILTATEEQKRFVESKQTSLEKKLLASRETAFLGNMLSEILTIQAMKPDVMERYHFFHRLYKELIGGSDNDTETDIRTQ